MTKVIVAGAGIGGLTAALSLIDAGFDVEVLEQAATLQPVGAGIQLSPNATRVLFGLGLGPALKTVTIEPGGKCIRHWQTGQEWTLFDLGAECISRYGYPYMMLYRPDLHRILVEGLASRRRDALRLGAKIVDVSVSHAHLSDERHGKRNHAPDAVTVTLADGTVLSADVLIGGDGVHSVVRAKLIAEDKPRFSGCIAWRGVIPVETLPPSMQGRAGVNWVGPGAHAIHYPIHAGRLVGFTGIVEKDGWFRESWTESGSVEECLADFNGWHPDIQALIKQLEQPLRWAMMIRDPIPNWTRGRVTLVGDAAHPTLPFLAQGAGMAIEDGCVLARALAAYRDDPATGLQVYQATRIERTSKIVLGSAANKNRFHSRELADPRSAGAYIEREWADAKVRPGYEWLFAYEPETVPLAIPNATAGAAA